MMETNPFVFPRTWRTLSLRRFKEEKFIQKNWEAVVHHSYIILLNKKSISLNYSTQTLPYCPSLKNLLQQKFPGAQEVASHSGKNGFQTLFLALGHPKNPVKTLPLLIEGFDRGLIFKLPHKQLLTLDPLQLKIYILPLTFLRIRGLYLKITKDPSPTTLTNSCLQEGKNLTSPEPQIYLTGQLILPKNSLNLCLLTQKTRPFKHKTACRVHTVEGIPCLISSVNKTSEYIKINTAHPPVPANLVQPVRVGLTLLSDAAVSFYSNPFMESAWTWNSLSVPLFYSGPPVVIPQACATTLLYKNKYFSAVSNLTSLIMDCGSDCFFTETTEWEPEQHVEIMVHNTKKGSLLIRPGDQIGKAFFCVIPKLPFKQAIPNKLLNKMSVAVPFTDSITVNAAKLPSLDSLLKFNFTSF